MGWLSRGSGHDADLSGARAVVVGNVARILLIDRHVLALTEIADHALDSLRSCNVEEVVIIGRRGPLQTARSSITMTDTPT